MDPAGFNRLSAGTFNIEGGCIGCAVFLLAALIGLGVGIGWLIWGC